MSNFFQQVMNTRPTTHEVDHTSSSDIIFNTFYKTDREAVIDTPKIGDTVKSCQYPAADTGWIIGRVVGINQQINDGAGLDGVETEYILDDCTDETGRVCKCQRRTSVGNIVRGDLIVIKSN